MKIQIDEITIVFPIPESEIPEVLKQLRAKIKVLNLEIDHMSTVIKQVQAYCPHKNTYVSGCYDGSSDTICDDCGKYL